MQPTTHGARPIRQNGSQILRFADVVAQLIELDPVIFEELDQLVIALPHGRTGRATLIEEIPQAYFNYLKEFGVDRKTRKMWKRLINMRYDEYSEDKLRAREYAIEMESKKPLERGPIQREAQGAFGEAEEGKGNDQG